MKLEHFVITRFCYRKESSTEEKDDLDFRFYADPLDPGILDLRWRLFETTCFPSLLGQTNQDFSLVVIVDQQLPPAYRSQLARLLRSRDRSFIRERLADADLAKLGWIKPLLRGAPDYILTTNLDDDDALPRTFLEEMRRRIEMEDQGNRLPSFKVFGSKNLIQWDMVASRRAPLGWKREWQRGRSSGSGPWPFSAGFSLLCRYPDYDISVLAVDHSVGEMALDGEATATFRQQRFIKKFRSLFAEAAAASGESPASWSSRTHFCDLGSFTGSIVVGNHILNAEIARLHEGGGKREEVVGPENFPDVSLDWNRARENLRLFRKTWRTYWSSLRREMSTIRRRRLGVGRKVYLMIRETLVITRGFLHP
jgi:hypothetical protein